MSGDANDMWVTIGAKDLKEFGQVVRKITETNVFPYVLSENGFSKVNENLYKKGDDQLIRIFKQEEKWQYQNLKNTGDKGSLIQFIANRLHTGDPIIAKEPSQLIIASKVAKSYHRNYIKLLRADCMTKLLQQSLSSKRQRRP